MRRETREVREEKKQKQKKEKDLGNTHLMLDMVDSRVVRILSIALILFNNSILSTIYVAPIIFDNFQFDDKIISLSGITIVNIFFSFSFADGTSSCNTIRMLDKHVFM